MDAAYAAAVVGLETEVFLEKIRENIGLQNIGLLVLDSPNGSMKRDAWTSSFKDILFALDFPELVDKPPVVPDPDRLPGAFVHIPDPNLRAAIAEVLGKSPNAPITAEEMERLRELDVPNRGIQDLTGLQFATNLNHLGLKDNQIYDLSPIAGVINLRRLHLNKNSLFNISPVAGLVNLERLSFDDNNIADLLSLAGLVNLEHLTFSVNGVSDLKPLTGLINLTLIGCWGHSVSDLSPLAGLTKLEKIDFCGGNISDLTPLAGLTGLEELYLANEKVSDISPLAGLTRLNRLSVKDNEISDISPIAKLTNLKWLELENTNISDVSFLAGLSQLKWLNISHNQISNLSPLDGLRENITLLYHNNPAFPKGGPKIEGPWLWVVLPDTTDNHVNDTDWLSEVSGGAVTEVEIATHGATEGKSVGDDVWTSHRLPPTGHNNIEDMLNRVLRGGTIYGSVSLHSPREQETTMHVGGDRGVRVWLNGALIYERLTNLSNSDYTHFFPVTLQRGRNVLLVVVHTVGNGFFGFAPDAEYTVANPGVGYTFSETPIHTGDTFTLDIGAENVFDLAGWQFDIAFDPAILEALNMSEGDFLKTDGGTTFFQGGTIDNAVGKITGLSAARLSAEGVTGTGSLLQVNFKAKSGGETKLTLQNFQLGSVTGDSIPAGPHQIRVIVEGRLATGDVNRDGVVSILDLILVAQRLGQRVPAGSAVDVNGDGVVSILDLIRVAQGIAESPAAPPNPPAPLSGGEGRVDAATIEVWIAQARLEDDGSVAFKEGIENLQNLLASLIPEETALLHNYPNPFNPETWIPYQLAESADVTLTIYDLNGEMIRHLAVGHQAAGMYQSHSRAAYWDGRNQLGEPVASGLYFYTLTAGEFTATRRMLILK